MQLRQLRLRFSRRLRKGQQQVEDLGQQTEDGIERHLFKRFNRLQAVRRFVIGWILLVLLLIAGVVAQSLLLNGYFQTLRPVAGGIYSEGVVGTFSGANPLYAVSDTDQTVSHLVFASLMTYNEHNQLVGDLASGYDVDARGVTYTVHLKPHLTWQDGKPLTSADVLFTYQLIQNPDVRSPLASGWQGITVTAPDAHTIVFKLPGTLASFPYNLTNGIVPQHILASITPTDLRTADFNTVHPVGSGPFSWQAIQVSGSDASNAREQIALLPFAGYQGGKPKLDQFVVYAYANQDNLVKAFQHDQLTAAQGLVAIPNDVLQRKSVNQHSFLLDAGTYAFFKTSSGVLGDTTVRQALVQASNVPQIVSGLGYSTHLVREPLLSGQLGYDPTLEQAGFDPIAAGKALDQAGWVVGKDGIRAKAGKQLQFGLTASDTPEYRHVSSMLAKQWKAVGVLANVHLEDSQDFQITLASHDYEAVLYGISIGADPDTFVYWDSSQADIRSTNRLNLSEYKSPVADAALEAGRTRLDPALRIVKYKPFLQAWQKDAPALGLYQPRLLYLTNGSVSGLNEHTINTATDRFDNVQNWEIREARVTNN